VLTASDAKEGDQVFRGHLTGYFLLLTLVAALKGRPTHETLESLRLTLLKIEQSAEPDQDAEALADLKRILLQRIAELEAIEAIESGAAETTDQVEDEAGPADLISSASMTVDASQGTGVLADVPAPAVESPGEPE
jgi:hypothetical protein